MSRSLTDLRLAVVGHIEWVQFLAVDQLPSPGVIGHALRSLEEPAGGGAVVAVQLARLIKKPVQLFTALGRDAVGEACVSRLQELGVELHVAWRDQPTRRGISLVEAGGDRAITVIGDRLTPTAADPLHWDRLEGLDGVFVTAADAAALRACRRARVLAATPRVRLPVLNNSGVALDALIGSGLDPGEVVPPHSLKRPPGIQISTEGAAGGRVIGGARYAARPLPSALVETYGCGDNFAAGVLAGLAAGWPLDQAIRLGGDCGAACATRFGPYA